MSERHTNDKLDRLVEMVRGEGNMSELSQSEIRTFLDYCNDRMIETRDDYKKSLAFTRVAMELESLLASDEDENDRDRYSANP